MVLQSMLVMVGTQVGNGAWAAVVGSDGDEDGGENGCNVVMAMVTKTVLKENV